MNTGRITRLELAGGFNDDGPWIAFCGVQTYNISLTSSAVPYHLQLWWLNKRNAVEVLIKHKELFLKSPTAVAVTGKWF